MSAGPEWSGMQPTDFDHAAAYQLPVHAPVRVPARSDRYGTEALFGDPVHDNRPSPRPTTRPGDIEGQDELF
ncbi:hypothetical protein AB0B50_04245 [Streptomyces sp. NPDC041068]|uniref:hypothetical protein n=1 Tax=Streptomyces sp. NPDC041068 TaxID=3155130 RepID=UPI0033DEB6D7